MDGIRAIGLIAADLERIADHAVNIVGQTSYFSEPGFFSRYDYAPFFFKIRQGLELVIEGFTEGDASQAMEITAIEEELDELYRLKFERILAEMLGGQHIPNLVTSLFIFHYLERMGDCLQNVGEAILFSKTGERLKIRQYRTLRRDVLG